MSTIIPFPSSSVPAVLRRVLAPNEAEENTRALDRFYTINCVARRLKAETITNQRGITVRFLEFAAKPLWNITPHDYERWVTQLLRKRPLAVATQRYYQGAIHAFFSYLVADLEYQNELHARVGQQVHSPLTPTNRIIHKTEAEKESRLWPLTREQVDRLFAGFDAAIAALPSKAVWTIRCMQRDKVAFAVQYYLALRVSELAGLDTDSFEVAPWTRQWLGRFGAARVLGKSSNGSAKKPRLAPTTTAALVPLMKWYLRHVRPMFPQADADAKKALFLGIHGRRLDRSSFIHGLKRYLHGAGLDARDFSTHTLRRSGLSHDAERADIYLAQHKGGHAFASTTQGYVRIPSETIARQLRCLVKQSLDDATHATSHRSGRRHH